MLFKTDNLAAHLTLRGGIVAIPTIRDRGEDGTLSQRQLRYAIRMGIITRREVLRLIQQQQQQMQHMQELLDELQLEEDVGEPMEM